MIGRVKAAYYLYILLGVFAVGGGLVYSMVSRVMPYHLQAIGVPWESLGSGVRALLWVLVKVIGGLSLILAMMVFFLVLIPFKRGERWAVLALPLLAFLTNVVMLWATIYVKGATGASTPVAMMAVSTGVVVLAFLLSMDYGVRK